MNGQGIAKRHSFPLRTYSWHGIRRNHIAIENGDDPLNPYKVRNAPVVTSEGTLEERETRLEEALLWIRKELTDMRHQDKYLTREFIQLRATIQRIRTEHETMLEEFENGESNGDVLKDLSDIPQRIVPRAKDGRPLVRKSYSMVI
ncbi:protein FAM167A [Exaiptasia diaphana]|uniref:Uncharacterized protein n=1 Tax=Exaiptasia diaphana TaxID=2652724 RepID=A0A913WX48_EXADI|nr:protein FAM167A [Exaiptasia diaphana]KXJ27661.1 Protein FAM167A [Exaiptasia diaphana]